MNRISHRGMTVLKGVLVTACLATGILWPEWRVSLQAQNYDCPTFQDASSTAWDTLNRVSNNTGYGTEFATALYKDANGCYRNTDIIQGVADSVSYEQGDFLLDQANRRGTPVAMLHTHPYPTGDEYTPETVGLSGEPGNKTEGDIGFAESRGLPIVALDVGPNAQNCAHAYDPDTQTLKSRCAE